MCVTAEQDVLINQAVSLINHEADLHSKVFGGSAEKIQDMADRIKAEICSQRGGTPAPVPTPTLGSDDKDRKMATRIVLDQVYVGLKRSGSYRKSKSNEENKVYRSLF